MSFLLQTHIVLGAIGLLSGLAPLVLTKGTKLHTALGGLFSFAMLLTGVSALFLTGANPRSLLTPLAILSLNQVVIGHTALYVKAKPMIAFVAQLAMIATVFFMGFAVYQTWPLLAQGHIVGIVTMAVAGGLIPLSIQDARHLFGNFSRKLSVRIHASRMIGAYLSATIAFLVNAISADWLSVLIPTLIGVGLIVYWSMRISKRGLDGMETGNLSLHSKSKK